MFKAIKDMLYDVRTINELSLEAERLARMAAQEKPGAEHYLLAALALEDDSARRVLARQGATPAGVKAAIAAVHQGALASIGVTADADADMALTTPPPKLFDAAASGRALVQALPKLRRAHGDGRLLGAHVLLAVAAMPHSTAARSLASLKVDLAALAAAAEEELGAA